MKKLVLLASLLTGFAGAAVADSLPASDADKDVQTLQAKRETGDSWYIAKRETGDSWYIAKRETGDSLYIAKRETGDSFYIS